jgi:hypothetical protein
MEYHRYRVTKPEHGGQEWLNERFWDAQKRKRISASPAAAIYASQATQITSPEQKQINDLSAAQSTIGIIKSQILFYQNILQSIIDKLQSLLNLVISAQPTLQQNK